MVVATILSLIRARGGWPVRVQPVLRQASNAKESRAGRSRRRPNSVRLETDRIGLRATGSGPRCVQGDSPTLSAPICAERLFTFRSTQHSYSAYERDAFGRDNYHPISQHGDDMTSQGPIG